MSFIVEFCSFLRSRKKFWLLPIIIVLLIFGGLLILAQGSAGAPFVYDLLAGPRIAHTWPVRLLPR